VDESNGDSVQRHGVAVKIENGKSNVNHVKRFLGRRWKGHHFDGVTHRDGFGFFTILDSTLDSSDRGWRTGWKDLAIVCQKNAVINSEFQRLELLVLKSLFRPKMASLFGAGWTHQERALGAGKIDILLLGRLGLKRMKTSNITGDGEGISVDFGDDK
jgi:hypothetical protein